MPISFFHEILSIILFNYFVVQISSNSNNIPSQVLASNSSDNHLSTITASKDNKTNKIPFSIVIRMIAFGIHHSHDNNEQKHSFNTIMLKNSNQHFLTSSKKLLNNSTNEKIWNLHKNSELLLLPLMIRMLLDRISQRTVILMKDSLDIDKSYKVQIHVTLEYLTYLLFV